MPEGMYRRFSRARQRKVRAATESQQLSGYVDEGQRSQQVLCKAVGKPSLGQVRAVNGQVPIRPRFKRPQEVAAAVLAGDRTLARAGAGRILDIAGGRLEW